MINKAIKLVGSKLGSALDAAGYDIENVNNVESTRFEVPEEEAPDGSKFSDAAESIWFQHNSEVPGHTGEGGFQATTDVGTSSKIIYKPRQVAPSFGGLVIVSGFDDSNNEAFTDWVMFTRTNAYAVESNGHRGSPPGRNYASDAGRLDLSMNSSSYDVTAFGFLVQNGGV